MLKFRQCIRGMGLLLSSTLLVIAIVFAETKRMDRTCQGIELVIVGDTTQPLVEKEGLLKRLTASTSQPIIDAPLQGLAIRSIENTIKSNSFVREGVVYKNWKGVLKIALAPRRPIARILYPHQQSQYVDEDGTLLPLSGQYTARVLLVEAEQLPGISRNLNESSYGMALLALFNYINQDPFWRAQIAHMHIDKQGKIVMNTQVSKQRIELGLPYAIEKKMAKLKCFYKQIIPYKGWNTYKRVNLEFDKQIVCE